jgi:hypothetical protein
VSATQVPVKGLFLLAAKATTWHWSLISD